MEHLVFKDIGNTTAKSDQKSKSTEKSSLHNSNNKFVDLKQAMNDKDQEIYRLNELVMKMKAQIYDMQETQKQMEETNRKNNKVMM